MFSVASLFENKLYLWFLQMKNVVTPKVQCKMLFEKSTRYYLPLKCWATHWIVSYIDAATDKTITRLNTVFFFRKCKSYRADTTDLFCLVAATAAVAAAADCVLHVVREADFTLYIRSLCCALCCVVLCCFTSSFSLSIDKVCAHVWERAYARCTFVSKQRNLGIVIQPRELIWNTVRSFVRSIDRCVYLEYHLLRRELS